MCTNFLKGNFEAGFKLNFNKDYEIVHFTEQRFTGFNVEEFENLFIGKNVDHITTAATDGMLEIAQERSDFKLTDHDLNSLQNTTWPTASGGNCWLLPVIYFISAARYYRPMTESEKKAILTTYGNYSNSINSYVIGQCIGYAEDSGLDGKADYDEMSHKIIDDEEYEFNADLLGLKEFIQTLAKELSIELDFNRDYSVQSFTFEESSIMKLAASGKILSDKQSKRAIDALNKLRVEGFSD